MVTVTKKRRSTSISDDSTNQPTDPPIHPKKKILRRYFCFHLCLLSFAIWVYLSSTFLVFIFILLMCWFPFTVTTIFVHHTFTEIEKKLSSLFNCIIVIVNACFNVDHFQPSARFYQFLMYLNVFYV